MKINACEMPTALSAAESDVYEKIRSMHCGRRQTGHGCKGAVTFDAGGMTLVCPLCGDARSVHVEAGRP